MRKVLLIGASVLAAAGCVFDPTQNNELTIDAGYDDISRLDCRGRWLSKVAECELQEAQEKLGAPERVTWECKQILFHWQRGGYASKCQRMQSR